MTARVELRWVFAWIVPTALALGCALATEEPATDDETTSAVGEVAPANESCTGEENSCAPGLKPAQLVGTVSADPPRQELDGEPLIIYVDDSISGAVLTVPFTEATITAANTVDAINAVTTGRVTATVTDGHITLTTVEAGRDVFLSVYDTAAARTLGLSELPLARGTTPGTQGK